MGSWGERERGRVKGGREGREEEEEGRKKGGEGKREGGEGRRKGGREGGSE